MNPKIFKEEQDKRLAYIDSIIKTYLPKEEVYQKKIFEAMNYSILAGGKRLRPMLMLETYRLFSKEETGCLKPFMAAIEMIHTYSLVHDDLPAMDNDEYRRGRKTTHVVYGEAMGILAGDGLLNYAFETACTAFQQGNDLVRVAQAMSLLAQKAGIHGMIGGQVVDMEGFLPEEKVDFYSHKGDGRDSTTEQQLEYKEIQKKLNYMYKLKTGALIEASMMIGAILAGAKEKDIAVVEGMALDIGLAFQIQDDILDVTSTTQVLGKPVKSDEKNHKITYATLLGIEKAKQEVVNLTNKSLLAFKELGRDNEFLNELILYLIGREK